jgi:hypothetical protein
MRALNLLDILIIGAVLALLVYAGTRDFHHYAGRTEPAAATTAPTPGK